MSVRSGFVTNERHDHQLNGRSNNSFDASGNQRASDHRLLVHLRLSLLSGGVLIRALGFQLCFGRTEVKCRPYYYSFYLLPSP
jgi:hypothetical protein